MDPIVKQIPCPSCGKPVNVRIMPSASKHTFHCPHCKNIVTAAT